MSVPQEVAEAANPVLSLPYYADILSKIGLASIGLGVVLILFVPVLKRWMNDVK
jgi:proton-dependent oligopeptide transporter, POT family